MTRSPVIAFVLMSVAGSIGCVAPPEPGEPALNVPEMTWAIQGVTDIEDSLAGIAYGTRTASGSCAAIGLRRDDIRAVLDWFGDPAGWADVPDLQAIAYSMASLGEHIERVCAPGASASRAFSYQVRNALQAARTLLNQLRSYRETWGLAEPAVVASPGPAPSRDARHNVAKQSPRRRTSSGLAPRFDNPYGLKPGPASRGF